MKAGDAKIKLNVKDKSETPVVTLTTPQQDKDWPEDQKIEWIKGATTKLLKTFNAKEPS